MARQSNPVVAYVPFATFLSAISLLENGIPSRIDPSVWPTYSVPIQSQLVSSFKFLGLIDNMGKPTPALMSLVHDKVKRTLALRKILELSYRRLIGLYFTQLPPRQFDEAMRQYGIAGE